MNQGKETVVTVVILDKGDNLDSYEWKMQTGRGISRGAIYSAGEKTMELSDCGRVQSGVNPIWPYP